MKTTPRNLPYEITPEGAGRPFLIIEVPNGHHAFPWHALRSLTLEPDAATLRLEFSTASIVIMGQNLLPIFDLAAAARLKCVRIGESPDLMIFAILPAIAGEA